jgi:hypothetical protein
VKIVLKNRVDSNLSALLRWTGNGSLRDLLSTASSVLRANGVRNAKLVRIGGSIAVQGIRSISVARRLKNLPGLQWIALGRRTEPTAGSVTESLLPIARNYLVKGSTFRVVAEVQGDRARESDFAGAASSRLLDEFRGTKIEERRPEVSFRVAVDSSVAVVGVEVYQGVGGAPTSRRKRAFCLVSGGMHSSVVAWMAAREGYSVSLVHVHENDPAMLEIARLYSELSSRMDPSHLSLDVLVPDEFSNFGGVLLARIRDMSGRILFSGAHAECRNASLLSSTNVASPLFLSSEEEFQTILRSLGLGGYSGEIPPSLANRVLSSRFKVRSFGGLRADAHTVLDALFS